MRAQAFAQIPDVRVYYGPDTYMGHNLASLLASVAMLSNDEIRALHPEHDRATIAAALPRLAFYREGTCVVHHMFGADVTERVRAAYGDALLTAHFEVRVGNRLHGLNTEGCRSGDVLLSLFAKGPFCCSRILTLCEQTVSCAQCSTLGSVASKSSHTCGLAMS